MGHADPSMGGHYRERIDDNRLHAVVEHVRAWLWPKHEKGGTTEPDSTTPQKSEECDPLQQGMGSDARATLRLFAG
jgi:hypothetical protein